MSSLPHTLEILHRTPATLRALLLGLSDHWTLANYGPGTWSAYQVLGHLIVAERDDWIPRLRIILQHGESRPFDPFPHDATISPAPPGVATSGVAPPGAATPLSQLLEEFDRLRSANLRELLAFNLSPADLERTGTHPALGRVTAGQLLATWAVHDLHHIRQTCLAMAWQHRDEVGSWRTYLNTLTQPNAGT